MAFHINLTPHSALTLHHHHTLPQGYVLDRVAVEAIVSSVDTVGLDITPVEDVKVGMAMKHAGIKALQTGRCPRCCLSSPK